MSKQETSLESLKRSINDYEEMIKEYCKSGAHQKIPEPALLNMCKLIEMKCKLVELEGFHEEHQMLCDAH